MFLQNNSVVSDLKTMKCMQILPATIAVECTMLIEAAIFYELDTINLFWYLRIITILYSAKRLR